jgi:hypothetical protein
MTYVFSSVGFLFSSFHVLMPFILFLTFDTPPSYYTVHRSAITLVTPIAYYLFAPSGSSSYIKSFVFKTITKFSYGYTIGLDTKVGKAIMFRPSLKKSVLISLILTSLLWFYIYFERNRIGCKIKAGY